MARLNSDNREIEILLHRLAAEHGQVIGGVRRQALAAAENSNLTHILTYSSLRAWSLGGRRLDQSRQFEQAYFTGFFATRGRSG